jgi:hypothetical protein
VRIDDGSLLTANSPLWVIFCRAISSKVRLLYPRKLRRQPFATEQF